MRRSLVTVLLAAALVGVLAAPAFAHDLEVRHPHTGELVNGHWVGGDTVPAPAQDAPPMFGPFKLPPSHDKGLPNACEGSATSPAVVFLAPPFGSCEHGVPL